MASKNNDNEEAGELIIAGCTAWSMAGRSNPGSTFDGKLQIPDTAFVPFFYFKIFTNAQLQNAHLPILKFLLHLIFNHISLFFFSLSSFHTTHTHNTHNTHHPHTHTHMYPGVPLVEQETMRLSFSRLGQFIQEKTLIVHVFTGPIANHTVCLDVNRTPYIWGKYLFLRIY